MLSPDPAGPRCWDILWHPQSLSVHDDVSLERKYDRVRLFRPFLLKYFSILEEEPMEGRGCWRWTNPSWEIWVDIELELASTHTESCRGDCLLLRFICIHTLYYTVTQFELGPGINPHSQDINIGNPWRCPEISPKLWNKSLKKTPKKGIMEGGYSLINKIKLNVMIMTQRTTEALKWFYFGIDAM